jgi:NAD(P)-dependent dehydrogenase (short-subunit alcohol dehydrogenase family)
MRLEGKVAIVTGSAQGIGAAFAERLAAEGAATVLAVRTLERGERTLESIRAQGGEAMVVAVDVADETQTLAMAEATMAKYGRIDILVNNAAMFISSFPRHPFFELDVADWDQMMAVNVRGTFLCCRAVFPAMKEQGKGKIINVTSSTFFCGSKDFLHYVTSKGAVVGLTRALAREVGEYNITVNSLAPGLTVSEGVAANYAADYLERFTARRCIPRLEVPEDLVGTCVFLASDDSDFVTGQHICIDGGDVFN